MYYWRRKLGDICLKLKRRQTLYYPRFAYYLSVSKNYLKIKLHKPEFRDVDNGMFKFYDIISPVLNIPIFRSPKRGERLHLDFQMKSGLGVTHLTTHLFRALRGYICCHDSTFFSLLLSSLYISIRNTDHTHSLSHLHKLWHLLFSLEVMSALIPSPTKLSDVC